MTGAETPRTGAHTAATQVRRRDVIAIYPSTENEIAISAINIVRVGRGKIAEHWINSDTLGMLVQLGVVPPPRGDSGGEGATE
jgi:hypothetical protein